MTIIRTWLGRHAGWAALLLALALLLRLLPGGTMLAAAPSATGMMTISVALCSGMAGRSVAITVERDAPAPAPDDTAKSQACAFAALGDGATGNGIAPLLLAALGFVLLAALAASAFAIRPSPRLRPPLRGPPILT